MTSVSNQHQSADLAHHVRQGVAWLDQSAEGQNSAVLSYAALELRFAIERLAVHYWRVLLNRPVEDRDLRDIESFKSVEHRIYELAGHQKKIDDHFEFMRIILGALKIDTPLHTPRIGNLSSYWHDCSKLCHIGWPLASLEPEVRTVAFAKLKEIADSLTQYVSSPSWPVLQEQNFSKLRDQFIAGAASRDDVLAYIRRIGLWAKAEFTDGRDPQFVGEPVEPRASADVVLSRPTWV